ncbi:U3 small nucleolar RNA-associated protein 15 homolog [Condylostylus longicornis]|uniref:U3 small nucleolar RNA-associated protein 15 homolog n=1 Tax=Condylostylus longicornis TaxID=2530218 RepID=UPI00244DB33B|nr:U3 small nucleolar RNA-associated protein 15 homolog [Condylostylus longicornis]
MANFKSLNTKNYRKPSTVVTSDFSYWKRLSVPTLVKEFGAIDYIDFSPVEPYYFAATCSVRVQVYNPITKLVVKNLSKFQKNAYGGSFRKDGRLLVAGDEEGFVKLFDVASKNVLRLFRGHRAPVHRVFFTSDLLHLASFSDDKTVKIWDIGTEKICRSFEDHSDYIRAGCVNPTSSNIILSGGYDNLVKMYDTRADGISFEVDHGCPVESLLFLPTGGIFISAGGTEIKVWDAIAGGKLLTKFSPHHKTITCLKLASNGKRILSGGLDRHVKVFDVASYKIVHNFDFPNSILSFGVSPNDQTFAVGMVDGLISIQNMEKAENVSAGKKKNLPLVDSADHIVDDYKMRKEKKYDRWFRKYEYTKALDEVLSPYIANKTPHVTISVMQELIHRKGLARALAGRTNNSIAIIIRFIKKHLGEHRFMRVMINVANTLLDVYEDKFQDITSDLGRLFLDLAECLHQEVYLSLDLLELEGAFEMLISAAKVTEDKDECFHFTQDRSKIKQSETAKEETIILV